MSQQNPNNGGGPPEDNPYRGPPEDVPGRGPPKRVRERFGRAQRDADSEEIRVGRDTLEELTSQVEWDNLSPFEEWVVGVLDEQDLIDDDPR
jgi:hypothetical protein